MKVLCRCEPVLVKRAFERMSASQIVMQSASSKRGMQASMQAAYYTFVQYRSNIDMSRDTAVPTSGSNADCIAHIIVEPSVDEW
jgi:hypothetical protein